MSVPCFAKFYLIFTHWIDNSKTKFSFIGLQTERCRSIAHTRIFLLCTINHCIMLIMCILSWFVPIGSSGSHLVVVSDEIREIFMSNYGQVKSRNIAIWDQLKACYFKRYYILRCAFCSDWLQESNQAWGLGTKCRVLFIWFM